MIVEEILVLLKKLKRDKNWLLNLILDSGKRLDRYISTEMSVYELLGVCNDNLKAKIFQELKGIEREYEANGYPPGFDSLPAIEISQPAMNTSPSIENALIEACKQQSIDYKSLTPIQRMVATHYRCPQCKMLPLYHLEVTYRERLRCKQCGQLIKLSKAGKFGKVRRSILDR